MSDLTSITVLVNGREVRLVDGDRLVPIVDSGLLVLPADKTRPPFTITALGELRAEPILANPPPLGAASIRP